MASVLSLTSRSTPTLGGGGGTVFLSLASGVAGLASISDTTAAGTLTAVTDGDYLLGLNAAGTFVRKVLKSSIITTDASLLTSGTLADARLSSNVPLKNAANVFTASQTVGNYRLNVGGLAAAASFHTAVDSGVLVKASSGRSLLEVHAPDDTARIVLQQISGNFGGYLTTTNYALTIGASKSQIRFGTQFSGAAATNTLFVNPDGANDANAPILAVLNSASQTADTLQLWGVSSTSTARAQAAINSGWADSTDATRTGQLSLGVYSYGGFQEGLRIVANATTPYTFVPTKFVVGYPIPGGWPASRQAVFASNAANTVALEALNYGAGYNYAASFVALGAGGINVAADFAAFNATTNYAVRVTAGDLALSSGCHTLFASNTLLKWNADAGFARNAAGVVEVNNGTAGTYRDLRLRNVRTEATTVAGLVAAATAGAGARAFVTDATATTFASAVTGGGANAVPVYSDGSAWYIG